MKIYRENFDYLCELKMFGKKKENGTKIKVEDYPWFEIKKDVLTKFNEDDYYDEDVEIPLGIKYIAEGAFKNAHRVRGIDISEGVIEIGPRAFEGCERILRIDIPGSVQKIGEGAFKGCSGLKAATISEGVKEIGKEAFAECRKLTKIELPESITDIGNYAFMDCRSLEKIHLPSGLKEIKSFTFQYSGLKEISIEGNIKTIGENAFQSCNLEKVKIAEGVVKIGHSAFEYCTHLAEITIPNSVTKLGTDILKGCKPLFVFKKRLSQDHPIYVCSENIHAKQDTIDFFNDYFTSGGYVGLDFDCLR